MKRTTRKNGRFNTMASAAAETISFAKDFQLWKTFSHSTNTTAANTARVRVSEPPVIPLVKSRSVRQGIFSKELKMHDPVKPSMGRKFSTIYHIEVDNDDESDIVSLDDVHTPRFILDHTSHLPVQEISITEKVPRESCAVPSHCSRKTLKPTQQHGLLTHPVLSRTVSDISHLRSRRSHQSPPSALKIEEKSGTAAARSKKDPQGMYTPCKTRKKTRRRTRGPSIMIEL